MYNAMVAILNISRSLSHVIEVSLFSWNATTPLIHYITNTIRDAFGGGGGGGTKGGIYLSKFSDIICIYVYIYI